MSRRLPAALSALQVTQRRGLLAPLDRNRRAGAAQASRSSSGSRHTSHAVRSESARRRLGLVQAEEKHKASPGANEYPGLPACDVQERSRRNENAGNPGDRRPPVTVHGDHATSGDSSDVKDVRGRPGADAATALIRGSTPPSPLVELSVGADSPALGLRLDQVTWPPGCLVVAVTEGREVMAPRRDILLRVGERVVLLSPANIGNRGGRSGGAA